MPRHERTDGEQAQTYNKNAVHTLATFAALDLSFYTGKGFHLALSFCFNQCHSSSFKLQKYNVAAQRFVRKLMILFSGSGLEGLRESAPVRLR